MFDRMDESVESSTDPIAAEESPAMLRLDRVEARALGCLVEKEITTPEYYPLTLKSLTAACNQKSNRNPGMSLTAEAVNKSVANTMTNCLGCRDFILNSFVLQVKFSVFR